MSSGKTGFRPYLVCLALVAAVTIAGEFVKTRIEPTNIVMVYLLIVVIAAVRWGRGPAAFASIVAVLAFDFFLVPPYLTFDVAHAHYILTFAGLLATGLVIGSLASRMREKTVEANRRAAQTAALHRLSADLAAADAMPQVLAAVLDNVSAIFDCAVAVFLPSGGSIERTAADPEFPATRGGRLAAARAFAERAPVDTTGGDQERAVTRYLPLDTPQGAVGVLGLSSKRTEVISEPADRALLQALANQAAVAIQRAKLAEEARDLELMRRTEKLYAALLSSVSHDLRTPLVSITGTLTALLDDESSLDSVTGRELLEMAAGESDRLNRLVGNLLDMTRMEAGALRIEKRPCDLHDVVGASLGEFRDALGDRVVKVTIARNFPEVSMDFRFMMKALCNVIDNAVKYSGPEGPIEIRARVENGRACIEVADTGPGIPPDDLKRVFDKFYRAERPRRVTGTGLGLSISKGIVEAHGGEIAACNNDGGGTTIEISLPLEASES